MLQDNAVDLFEVEKLAAKYCETYDIQPNTKEYVDVHNAFCVGYAFGFKEKKCQNY